MRRLVFALLLLVSGCGREAIDLDRTITLRIAGLAGIAPWADTVATGTMVAAVAALGGHTGEGAEQVVFVWPGAAEACVARGESVGFAVPEHYSLFVCPPAGREPAWLRSVLRHELGHLLGASHLPCATGAVMERLIAGSARYLVMARLSAWPCAVAFCGLVAGNGAGVALNSGRSLMVLLASIGFFAFSRMPSTCSARAITAGGNPASLATCTP